MAVRWNNEFSDSFGVSKKQGGVLSSILFCIYIDNLLMSLKNNDIGCHVGSHCCGAFEHADDIMLLSRSSMSTSHALIDLVEEISESIDKKIIYIRCLH